jgi:cytochrome c6
MSAQANAAKLAAAGAALLVATPAFAGDGAAGEKIFNANCAACHAGEPVHRFLFASAV